MKNTMHPLPRTIVLLPLAASLVACSATEKAASTAGNGDGWVSLFDGTDPSKHLRGFRRADFPVEWKVEDGAIVLPDAPGFGIDIDPEKVARYRIET